MLMPMSERIPRTVSFGDIAAWVHRDGRAAPIGVPHDVVTAFDAGYLEAGSL